MLGDLLCEALGGIFGRGVLIVLTVDPLIIAIEDCLGREGIVTMNSRGLLRRAIMTLATILAEVNGFSKIGGGHRFAAVLLLVVHLFD